MKKIILYFFFSSTVFSIVGQNKKQCSFGEIHQRIQSSPDYEQRQLEYIRSIKEIQHNKMDTVIVIPTVIHVIYKNSTENISTAQIMSQLDALNKDFRKLNSDTTNVASGFSKADVKIEFALAIRDPQGNTTNGITRTFANVDDIGSTSQYYSLQPAWNNKRYLNIWVCDIDDFTLGFAYPPNSPGVSPQEDGVVIGPEYFGTIGTVLNDPSNVYNKGRTTTHEIGHYFDLLHLWGNDFNPSCSTDDQIADTPNQDSEVYDCPSSNFSCGSNDMLSNFLGYIDDACMGNFTLGQKTRMRNALYILRDSLQYGVALGITSLKEVNELSKANVFPNPTLGNFQIELPNSINRKTIEIQITDITGKQVAFRTKNSDYGLAIELVDAAKGIYFVKLKEDNFSVTKKLIKH